MDILISSGTMIGFAAFSINQELAKKVKTFSALAPVATVSHIKGALKIISNFAPQIEVLDYTEHIVVLKQGLEFLRLCCLLNLNNT